MRIWFVTCDVYVLTPIVFVLILFLLYIIYPYFRRHNNLLFDGCEGSGIENWLPYDHFVYHWKCMLQNNFVSSLAMKK